MRGFAMTALVCAAVASGSALAVQPNEMLKDQRLEERARELSRELRCMVCQNQSIDDSEAPLARDLRVLVRERLTKGDTDQQVLDYLVARYGEFVLLKPRLESEDPSSVGFAAGDFNRRRCGTVSDHAQAAVRQSRACDT